MMPKTNLVRRSSGAASGNLHAPDLGSTATPQDKQTHEMMLEVSSTQRPVGTIVNSPKNFRPQTSTTSSNWTFAQAETYQKLLHPVQKR